MPAKKLIESICQVEPTPHPTMIELLASIKVINELASKNKTLIDSLTAKHEEYVKTNTHLTTELELLKVQECKRHWEKN